jgi:hypothetical protein
LSREEETVSTMRMLGLMMVLTPLLLAACGDESDAPPTAPPAQAPSASLPAPIDATAPVPLRQTPEGLLRSPATPPSAAGAPAVSPAAPGPQPEDEPPSEAEVRALYEGIMYTYAFDACGLPLIGQTARQDIEQRIEICPNPALRKEAFRTVYRRAIEVAEHDPEKMRVSAGRACPDKREFLRRVMSHAGELQFDDSRPPDCVLLSPAPPGNPATDGAEPLKAQKPF